jgi:DNA-binding transcriptional regulator YdaS (Cro superfamily)
MTNEQEIARIKRIKLEIAASNAIDRAAKGGVKKHEIQEHLDESFKRKTPSDKMA